MKNVLVCMTLSVLLERMVAGKRHGCCMVACGRGRCLEREVARLSGDGTVWGDPEPR